MSWFRNSTPDFRPSWGFFKACPVGLTDSIYIYMGFLQRVYIYISVQDDIYTLEKTHIRSTLEEKQQNDNSSNLLEPFQTSERRGGAHMGLSERIDTTLN